MLKSGIKKDVILEELNLSSLPFLIFFLLIGRRVWFFKFSLTFSTFEYVSHFLKRFDVLPLSFDKGQREIIQKCFLYQKRSQDSFGHRLAKTKLYQSLERVFGLSAMQKKRLYVCSRYSLNTFFFDLGRLTYFSKDLENRSGQSPLILAKSLPIYLCSAEKINLSRLFSFFYFLLSMLEWVTFRVYGIIMLKLFPPRNSEEALDLRNTSSLKEFQVAYFPHMGVYYSNLFLKDQFYSHDTESAYCREKIVHLGVGDPPGNLRKSIDYYRKNKVPYSDVSLHIDWSIKKSIHQYFKSFWNCGLVDHLLKLDLLFLLVTFYAFHSLKKYESFLKQMPRLKVAFIGYVVVFPPFLILAMDRKGVKTIGTQERFLLSFCDVVPIIVNNYLTQGVVATEAIKRLGEETIFVDEFHEIGPIRTSKFSLKKLEEGEEKFLKIKESKFLILVLDYFAQPTEDESRLNPNNNWGMLKRFYEDIISIAEQRRDAYFVIKGKDDSLSNHPFFKGISKKLSELENVHYETDLDRYDPYYIGALSDGAIALHTSLGDEMLAVGKPVIFHDVFGYPTGFFNYPDLNIISCDREGLLDKVDKMILGHLISEDDFKIVRERYYCQIGGLSSQERLSSYLQEFIPKYIES